MPIQSCTLSGGGKGYKWGKHGKCYPSRKQAIEQMRAIFHSGYTGAEIRDIAESLTDNEFNELIGDKDIPFLVRTELSQARNKWNRGQ